MALSELEQYPEACALFHTVVHLQPDNAQAHFNLALSHLAQANLEAARACLAVLESLHPAFADELRQEIEQLQ